MKKEKRNEIIDLWDFSKIVTQGVWEPIPHLNIIVEFLHYAFNGQLENFACALSPRLGKSMTCQRYFRHIY